MATDTFKAYGSNEMKPLLTDISLTLFRLGFFGVHGPGGGFKSPLSINPKVLTQLS